MNSSQDSFILHSHPSICVYCLCHNSGTYASTADTRPDKEHRIIRQSIALILIVSLWISLPTKNIRLGAWSLAGSFIDQCTTNLVIPNLTVQSKVEVPRKKQEVIFFQPNYRHFRQWFSQREGFNSAVKHSISQLFSTPPVVRSANQWRWDWPCIWTGDGHLQLPLHSDPSLRSLFHNPFTSIPPVRQDIWWLRFQTRSLSPPNTTRVLQLTWSGGGQA